MIRSVKITASSIGNVRELKHKTVLPDDMSDVVLAE